MSKFVTRGLIYSAPDDVVVIEFLQQTDLTNGGAGHPFVFCLESDLLQSDDLVGTVVFGFVYNPICS